MTAGGYYGPLSILQGRLAEPCPHSLFLFLGGNANSKLFILRSILSYGELSPPGRKKMAHQTHDDIIADVNVKLHRLGFEMVGNAEELAAEIARLEDILKVLRSRHATLIELEA